MDEWVELVAVPFPIAQIVKGALDTEGIPARVHRDVLGAVYGLDVGALATRVLVPPEHLDRARALIDEIESADAGDG